MVLIQQKIGLITALGLLMLSHLVSCDLSKNFSDVLFELRESHQIMIESFPLTTILAEPDLLAMPSFTTVFSYPNTKTVDFPLEISGKIVDCDNLARQTNENGPFLYISASSYSFFDIEFFKCSENKENLLGIVVVNKEKLQSGLLQDPFEIVGIVSYWINNCKVKSFKMCENSYLNRKNWKCERHDRYQRVDEAFYEMYYEIIGDTNDVPLGVNLIGTDTTLTSTFHEFLVSQLKEYTFGSLTMESHTDSAVIYLNIHSAVIVLFTPPFVISTDQIIEDIYSICGAAYSVLDPQEYTTDFFNYYNLAAYYYLEHFKTSDRASVSYASKINTVNTNLNSFYLAISKNGLISAGVYIPISSSNLVESNNYVSTLLSVNPGDYSEGSCDFNSPYYITIRIMNTYGYYGMNSDIYSYIAYIGGINGEEIDTFFENPILGTITNSCFAKYNFFQLYTSTAIEWECYSTGQNCYNLVYNYGYNYVYAFMMSFGFYILKPFCNYGQTLSTVTYDCITCDISCTSCLDSESCVTCANGLGFNGGNLCQICDSNEYIHSTTYMCTTCPSSCLTCYDSQACIQCASGLGFHYQISNLCETCYSNEFINPTTYVCTICDSSCATCSSQFVCTTCSSNLGFRGSTLCESCLSFEYIDPETYACTQCSNNCLSCTDANTCTSCLFGYGFTETSNNLCVLCGNGMYTHPITYACTPCPSSCATCYDSQTCITCASGLGFNNADYLCESCDSSEFIDPTSYICTSCHGSCATCSSVSSCLTCISGLGFLESSGTLCGNCNNGQYPDTSTQICTQCDPSCSTCLSGTSCLTCAYFYGFIAEGNGLCEPCNVNQYVNQNQICTNCPAECSTCSDQFTCTSCSSGYGFKLGISNLCVTCSSNEFIDPSTQYCVTCNPSCLSCTDLSHCTACISGYGFNNGITSYCQFCDTNEYIDPTTYVCTACNTNCLTCSSPTTCITCAPGFGFNNDGDLICGLCNSNEYIHPVTQICTTCDSSCLTCLSGQECILCAEGLGFNDIDALCEPCDSAEYISSNQYCVPCEDAHCTQCSAQNYCDACQLGYVINSFHSCSVGSLFFLSEYLVSFVFDSTFSYIYLTSTKKFILNTSVDCMIYFTNYGILGSSSSCSAKSDYILQITLGSGWTIRDTSTLITSSTFLMREGNYALYEAQLLTPSYPNGVDLNPHARISGNSKVWFSCSSQSESIYSSSQSYGIGASSFNYLWSISESSITLQDSDKSDCKVIIPSATTLTSFQISLAIKNFLEFSSTIVYTVAILSDNGISFKLDTGEQSSYKRSQSFIIIPVNIDSCGLSGTISYIWTLSGYTGSSIALGLSKLSIPKQTLEYGEHIISLNIILTGSVNLSGTSTTKITITSSDLVAIINKGNQEISDSLDFTAIGSLSYDPDGYSLSYSWTSSIITSTQASSSITILKSNFQSLSSFDLTLTVTHTETSRSSSTKITLTIKPSLAVSVSIISPGSKVRRSNYVVLNAKVVPTSTVSSISLLWTQSSGIIIPYTPLYYTYLTIPPNTLTSGISYSFIVTTTVIASSVSATATGEIFFRVNIGPNCPNIPTISPNTNMYAITTKFTISIKGCVDGDTEDIPLKYKFSGINGAKTLALTTASENSVTTGFRLSSGITAIEYTICDTMSDCTTSRSASFTLLNARRLLRDEESLVEDYKQFIITQDLLSVIIMFLDQYEIPEVLLDLMWNDFTNHMAHEMLDSDYTEELTSIILMFLNDNQSSQFMINRLPKYTDFLILSLNKADYINKNAESQLLTISEIILNLSDNIETITKLKEILHKLLVYKKVPGFQGFTYQNPESISIYIAENFATGLVLDIIELGENNIKVGSLSDDPYQILTLEFMSFGQKGIPNIINLSIFSNKAFDGQEIIEHDMKNIDLIEGDIIVTMKTYDLEEFECRTYKNMQWVNEDCVIISHKSGKAQISLLKSGLYSLFDPTSISLSFGPLYLITSLIAALAIIMPFLVYFDSKAAYLSIPTQNLTVDKKSDRDDTSLNLEKPKVEKETLIRLHLTVSIFYYDKMTNRAKKILILFSNIVFEICLQNLIFSYLNLHPVIVGLVSVMITFLPFVINMILANREGVARSIVMIIISLLMIAMSLIVTALVPSRDGWVYALLAGLGFEFYVSQIIVMIVKRAISKN
ncbi:hypothetical protein SteCoe_12058 [Stentor coeruleus]|uniref:EGF-like domain-containing protein n=1 Tax=Stentor coeruleus TaxID=5963 RepID=A0A1R2CBL0_9CILI|nr:hypothetical protein SteCoe_12058 [Stentor coeruleus]